MPIIKSAQKRVRTAAKATARNTKTKRSLKTAVKALQAAAQGGKESVNELKKAQSAIDKAVKKNVMHKNKAARKKRQLVRAAKAAGGDKPTATVKKAAPQKAVAKKKSAPKKPVAKTSAKKPAKKK